MLLAFVVLWTSITVAADYVTVSNMVLQMQTESWPSVQGTITRSEVEAVRSNKSTTYGLKVAYTYSVDGQHYEGSRARPAMWRSGGRGFAEELVARYPLGATIPVYYRPGQPSEAVLQTGMDGSALFTLMLLMPFNLVMLWLGTLVVGAWKPEPPLLSTFFREDGSECVTLDGPWTTTFVALSLVGASLACVALAGVTVGLHAPLPVAVGAWGVVIVCGVLTGRWSYAREKAGHYDLRLHAQARSLSLPPFSERKHRLDLRWRDVRSLRVAPQAPTKKGGQVSRYHLTLEHSTAEGEVRQEAITGFPRQEQAEALARWLRTHLEVGEVAEEERRSA
ncbi:DUF3592 domain-containing protein [Myxococcus sp. 1LA]